jgi:hypothetical protein
VLAPEVEERDHPLLVAERRFPRLMIDGYLRSRGRGQRGGSRCEGVACSRLVGRREAYSGSAWRASIGFGPEAKCVFPLEDDYWTEGLPREAQLAHLARPASQRTRGK